MKKIICFILISPLLWLSVHAQNGSVGIGTTTPHSSAVLDVQSTDKGMLIPRMTTAQRNLIASPATGLMVFDNTTGSFWFYNGSAWTELVGNGTDGNWTKSGDHIYNNNTGNVGIGTNTPIYDLYINRPSPSIGFFDSEKNHASGLISGDSSNLEISAYKKSSLDLDAIAGNLILQNTDAGVFSPIAGKVGIGTKNPTAKLDVNGNIRLSGILRHTTTSVANMIPICYGVVEANGNIVGGTANFTVANIAPGHFRITILGFTGSSPAVLASCTIGTLKSIRAIISNNVLDIYCYRLNTFPVLMVEPYSTKFTFFVFQD